MKTIAVIDDDVAIGDLLAEVLTQEGYDVLRAYSGDCSQCEGGRDWPFIFLSLQSQNLAEFIC